MTDLKINIKSISNKKNKIKTTVIPCDDSITDIRELLTEIVKYCVKTYNERMESSEILNVFTREQIEDKAQSGKVSFGVIYGENKADIVKATENALEAFSDGIVALFVDDKRIENIDEKIDIKNIGSLTFIKLSMLAGRMW